MSERARALEQALRELTAMVRGECPSLLNEDSGGNGDLSYQIEKLLAIEPPSSGASPQAETSGYIDIVFDGPSSHVSGWFIEVENVQGASISVGKWVHRTDGYWALRLPAPVSPVEPTPEPETCEWRYSADAEWWQSGCDSQDLSGDERLVGPDEKAKFCPYCGKPLRLVPSEETK